MLSRTREVKHQRIQLTLLDSPLLPINSVLKLDVYHLNIMQPELFKLLIFF